VGRDCILLVVGRQQGRDAMLAMAFLWKSIPRAFRLLLVQQPTLRRPSPREIRWNIPDGLTEEQLFTSTDGAPCARKEYSTRDIGDHISSPTRQDKCRQIFEMNFHPYEKKFVFFPATSLIPSPKTHFSRRSFGIKRYIIEALYFLDRPRIPQKNVLEHQCPLDPESFFVC